MRSLLFTLGVGAGFFLAMYQWITMLGGGALMANAMGRWSMRVLAF